MRTGSQQRKEQYIVIYNMKEKPGHIEGIKTENTAIKVSRDNN